jgi:DNA polymerase-1
MRDTLLLIDANSLIHRAFHALPPLTAPDGRPVGALYGLASIIIKILKDGPTGEGSPEYIAAAFDRPEPTHRESEYKEYKATRPPAHADLVSQLIESHKLFKIFGIKTFEFPGWEADDIIATLAGKFSAEWLKVFILSGDRDILQMVNDSSIKVIMPQRGISNTTVYDKNAVKEKFGIAPNQLADYKGLVGDASDNIPGVPSIGPKTAADLISRYGSLENLYREVDSIGIPNKNLQTKLKTYREQAFLSKRLATLESKLPIEVSIDNLIFRPLPEKDVADYFEHLGFKSLLERFKRYISNEEYLV